VSAGAMPEKIERIKLAGAKYYLAKPLDIVEFLKVVDAQIK
jgi:AmiR/NasT family two-component response regulator